MTEQFSNSLADFNIKRPDFEKGEMVEKKTLSKINPWTTEGDLIGMFYHFVVCGSNRHTQPIRMKRNMDAQET